MAIYYFGETNTGNGVGTQANPWNQAGFTEWVESNSFQPSDQLVVQGSDPVQLSISVGNSLGSITGDIYLTDSTLNATALKSLDVKTSGNIDARNVDSITGLAIDIGIVLSDTGITASPNVAVTTSAGQTRAHDLNLVDSKTTAIVDATAITTIEGDVADVKLAIASPGINTSSNYAVRLNVDSVLVSDANIVDADTTGVVTATIFEGDLATLATLTGTDNAYTITLSDATVAASALNTLDGKTTVAVNAGSITLLTGSVADALTAYNSAGISGLGDEAITISDTTLAATELNALDAKTSGIINASSVNTLTGAAEDVKITYASGEISGLGNEAVTLSGSTSVLDANSVDGSTDGVVTASISDTTIATLSGLTGTGNAYMITVEDAAVDAAALNTLDGKTTVTVDAAGVGTLTGTAAAIDTAINAATIDTDAAVLVNVNDGPATVAQANSIDAKTTGVVTATISDTTIATLSGLNGTDNAYTISVTDAAVNAADLNTLDGKTTVTVNAAAVGRLTGTAAAINTAINAATIDTDAAVLVNVNSGSATVAQANSIDAKTTGVVTATISDTTIATLSGLTGTGNAYTITVDDAAVDAAALNTLDGKTTVTVYAAAVGTLTGTAAAINTAINAATIDTDAAVLVNVNDGPATVAQANSIDAQTTGVVTATISEGDLATLATLTGTDNAYTITVDDAAVDAAALITLDGKTTVTVNAAAVGTLTGTAAAIDTAINAATIDTDAAVLVNVNSGSATVAQVNSIDAQTTGVVTATISDTTIATLSGLTGTGNAYTITVDDAAVDAAALNTLDGKTTVTVNAAGVGTLTGTAAAINTAINAGTIDTDAAVLVNVNSGSATVAQANSIDAKTTGVVTATISEGNLATLATLTGTDNAYTISLSDTTAAASDLNSVDTKTTVTLNAGSVTTLTGAAADVNATYSANTAGTISGLGDEAVTLNDTTLTATVLNAVDGNTTGVVNAASVATLNGLLADVNEAYAANSAGTISGLGNEAVIIGNSDGTLLASDLATAGNATSGTVTVTNSQTVTGTVAEVTAALVTDSTKVVMASASTATMSNAATAAEGAPIASTANITASFTSGISDTLVNLASSGTISANLSSITADQDNVVITIKDAADGTVQAADLSAVGTATTGAVSVTNSQIVNGTADQVIAAVVTPASKVDLNSTSTLNASNYSIQDLSGVDAAFTLNVTTINGAVLDAAKLATVDSVTLFGVNTATAADADSLGSRLSGTATVNITTDTINVNTDLSDLGSSLTLQFGVDNTAVVDGATLSVRQDQVNSYTISGTGTVNAEGSTSADTFDASGISATLNLSSFAGDDSITVNPADLSSADVIDGGDGTDTLIFSAPTTSVLDGAFTKVFSVEILQLADGTNTISLGAQAEAAGITTVTGGTGKDTLNLLYGSTDVTFNAGKGFDTLSYSGDSATQTISLIAINDGTASGTVAGGGTDSFTGLEEIVGGSGTADSITSTNTTEALIVTSANAGTIDGFAFSGVESVNLSGGDDTATINDGGSVASLGGGIGNDTLNLDGANNSITITGTGAGTTAGTSGGTTTFSGFETVNGLDGDDAFIVNSASSTTITLAGGEGTDSLSVAASDSTANSLTISGVGSGTLGTIAFSGIETINLGSGSDTVTLASMFLGTIDGGAGDSDVLNLNASANDVIFTSPGSGTWGSTIFSNFEVVNLLGGDDSLRIEGTGSFTSVDGGAGTDILILNRDTSSDVVTVTSVGAGSISSGGTSIGSFTNFESINLGSGSDTLNYADYGSAVSITLDSITTGTGTTTTGGATGFSGVVSGFETVVGSGSSDTLIASATDNTLILTGANQGTIDGLNFSSFETIDLAAGNDIVQFTSGDSLSGTLAGGDGIDTLDYSAYGSAVVVNLATGTATATGGISGFETVLGSSGNDTITASTSGDVNLQGKGGNDTFNVTVAGFTNTDTIAGGDGSDRIVFTDAGTITDVQFTNVSSVESVTLTGASTISAGTEASQAGIATVTTGTGATTVNSTTANYDLTVNATSLGDGNSLTLTGSANTNDFTVTGLNGSVLASGTSGTLTINTVDAGDDTIGVTTGSGNTTINASGANDIVTVNAEQMADNTTLDINGSATFTVSNLEANTDAAGSSGALSITFSNITDNEATLLSGSGNVVVNGGDVSDTVTVTGLTTNNQTFNAQASASNFNITAGAGNQTITGSNTGNDSIDGGSGYDTLSYAGGNNVDVTISSYANQAGSSTGQGSDSFTGIESLVGATGNGNDILRGTNAATDEVVTVTGANTGAIRDSSSTGSFSFSSFEQLDLQGGNDVLAITGIGSLSSSADGGAGTDRLDYSAYTAGSVTVDLNTGTATAIAGGKAGGLIGTAGDSSFEDVYGSAFSDTITGDNTANFIRGYGGNDTIFGLGGDDTIDGGDGTNGPDGDDLIVAGDGADLILGSAGNDFISGGGYTKQDGTYYAVGDDFIDTLSYIARNEGLDLSLTGIDQGTVQADAGSSLAVSTFTNTYSSTVGQQLITVPTNQVTTDWTDMYGDIQNLVLTNQNDIVRFDVGDVNTGSIDAAGGSLDTLDYSSFGANSPVLVNLSDKANYKFDFDDNKTIDTTIGEIEILNARSATNVMVSAASSQGGAGGVLGFEVVIGGAGDDAIVGNDAGNLLVGNAGNDRIAGGAGSDTIYGGDGDDYIIPGDGKDYVFAGAGLNTIVVTSSDLAEDVFSPDPNGINTFKLQGDGTQTTTIQAPTGTWNPGAQGIALVDGGDPVIDSNGVTTYDTIQGSAGDDTYEFGGTALKNIDLIDLGDGDDSVGTAASTKGIKVTYDGGAGTDSIALNFTFAQFAKLNAAGLYVADVQNFLDKPTGETFSSSQAGFTAQNFEAGGVAVITPAVYNALQGDPAALTFNSAFGVRDSTISSGDDVTLTASALTTSTATALSAADIVSAFVQASGVKGSDDISISSGGSITGSSTASQDAVALSRTVDDRADSVLSAYGLGTDRSSFTAGDDITLSLSGSVKADTTAEAAGFVVTANGTVEVAGSRDSSLAAADALDLTITASGLQTVAATNVEGLAIAGLASRAYGIDDANLTDSTSDSVQAGSALNLLATASSNNRVTAQTAGNEALGTITLVNNGPAANDRFTISQTGASFPLINGDRVRFTSSNASVQADRDYYVINAIGNLGEFQLSSAPDGSPLDVVATGTGTLQAYRPAVATADAISTVTGVELNRTGAGLGGVQAGDALSLQATATDVITATAASMAGDATAGVFRLGAMDGLNLASEVSSVQALVDTVSLAGRGASLNLNATDTATLSAVSTEGAALTEANIQVFGSKTSASTAGDDLSLSANAELNLSGTASSTAGSAEARSGAGAGAGVATPLAVGSGSNVVPTASSFSVVTGLADGTQTAGTDLAVQARGATTLNATASTVSGAGTLGSLWTSATGDILATFDLHLDTTNSTPSFVGPQYLAAGQLVQLDAASAAATGLAADTDYAVKLLGFAAVDAATDRLTMPTGITYALNDAVRFRLNSTAAPNSDDSRYGLDLGTTYYVVSPFGTTFQLSASPGGPPINLSPDSLGPADQLVDADRFQLLTLPTAPGGTYSVATLNPGVAGTAPTVSLTLPSVANAFAGSREADRTLNSSDDLNLAQVSGISGNGGLRGLIAGAQNAITAMASGVLNAIARNTDGDATASAGLVAEGLSDTAISAGSTGSVNAEASITAIADAATTGDNALLDNALADLTITARGLSASDAANAINIGGAGDVQSTASLSGRSTASTVLGDSDALASLQATGLEALDDGFTATIGQQGAIRAAASIGSLAAPLIISALSSAEGDATAQAAAAAVGILGTYDATVPAGFSSLQAGTSQGDISGSASADLNLRAIAVDGVASVSLGTADIFGIKDMALTTGAEFSQINATALGQATLLAQTVDLAATSAGSTSSRGLFSSAASALPVNFSENGSISAIAQQSSFSQSISVNGNASSSLNNTSLGIGNATITISGDGSLDARALSQLDSRSQSVAGAARA